MPVAETLGYINNFIEKMELHVILIGNEKDIEEIEEASGGDRMARYSLIREKVIGRRLEIAHDPHSVLDHFIEKLTTPRLRYELNDFKETIVNIYRKSESNNLRILYYALFDFERLWKKLAPEQKKCQAVLERLLITFLCFKFDFEMGVIGAENIKTLESDYLLYGVDRLNDDEAIKKPKIVSTIEKYHELNTDYLVLSTNAWSTYFDKGNVSDELVQECVKKSGLIKSQQSPLVTLWYWAACEDDELEQLVKQHTEWLKSFQIKAPFELLHLAGIFLRLSGHKIISLEKEQIINMFTGIIDGLGSAKLLEYNNPVDFSIAIADDHWGQLSFQNASTREFKQIKEYLIKKLRIVDDLKMEEDAKKIPEMIKTDFNNFLKLISYDERRRSYYNKPILRYVDPNAFFEALTELPNARKRMPYTAIKERYEIAMDKAALVEELKTLQTLDTLTTEYVKKHHGKNSVAQLEIAQKYLKHAIGILEEEKNLHSSDNANE